MSLPDSVLVYPAHGAGSACGKNMSKETFSTIGEQKANNYALRANMTEKEFIAEVTDGLLPPPPYFSMNVALNKNGIQSIDKVLDQALIGVDVGNFENLVAQADALILDTRNSADFCKGYIPNAISIGISGDFAPWVGSLIENVNQTIILVTEIGKEEETITRLARIGFDNIIGYLEGGFQAWKNANKEFDTINRISAEQFSNEAKPNINQMIDIRRTSEYEAEHVDEAFSKPLANINQWINTLDKNQHFYMYCAGGYRSMIAASILQARGFRNFTEIEGGFNAIAKTNMPKSNYVCQSKL